MPVISHKCCYHASPLLFDLLITLLSCIGFQYYLLLLSSFSSLFLYNFFNVMFLFFIDVDIFYLSRGSIIHIHKVEVKIEVRLHIYTSLSSNFTCKITFTRLLLLYVLFLHLPIEINLVVEFKKTKQKISL